MSAVVNFLELSIYLIEEKIVEGYINYLKYYNDGAILNNDTQHSGDDTRIPDSPIIPPKGSSIVRQRGNEEMADPLFIPLRSQEYSLLCHAQY